MFCKYCGAQVPDGSEFCPNCGKSLAKKNPQPENQQPASQGEPTTVMPNQPTGQTTPIPEQPTQVQQPTQVPPASAQPTQVQQPTQVPPASAQPTQAQPIPQSVPGGQYQAGASGNGAVPNQYGSAGGVPPAGPGSVPPQSAPPAGGGKKKSKATAIIVVIVAFVVAFVVGLGVSNFMGSDTSGDDESQEQTDDSSSKQDEEAETKATDEDADSLGVAYDEESETYNSKCVDANDNVTAYAIIELNGSELSSLLDDQSYFWYQETDTEDQYYVRYSDKAAVAVYDQNLTTYDEATFSSMDVAPNRGATLVIDSVGGYYSSDEALSGACQLSNVEDPIVDSEEDVTWALVADSAGNHYLILVGAHGDGTYDLIIFNDESVSSGLFESMTDVSGYSSVDELWAVLKEGQSEEVAQDTQDSGVMNT